MTERFVKHATFVVERTYAAAPARVYQAWADPAAKAEWFSKPDIFEFRVGGRETSSGGPPDGPIFTFDACYQEIVPEQRIVYTYTLDAGDTRISVSITTIELISVEEGTKLVFTEQAAFFDGYDTPEVREQGTNEMLDLLGKVLEGGMTRTEGTGDCEIISSRVLDFQRERVFQAFTDPGQLARWWGPNGFTNTFYEFDLRPGGTWRFVMHGPDGVDYPNHSVFVEVVPLERFVFHHLSGPEFQGSATFEDLNGRTKVTFRQLFMKAAEFEQVKNMCVEANEQNFDRLSALLVGQTERL